MPDVTLSATRKKTAVLMTLQRTSVRRFSQDLAIVLAKHLPACTIQQVSVSVLYRRCLCTCGNVMIDIAAKSTPDRLESLDSVVAAVTDLVARYQLDQHAYWLSGGVDIFVRLPASSFRHIES